ncbi:uncharacterized protein BO95DRAFT_517069 [Aspergillus brunneoviolaceus CBS 621.78]|uniref:Uncharacterized protein n=1 Tax=Aspergillus brunneoviolaceus CBS 621.78 TaxID=1450534 RepID=A0ACD1FZS6_9EURO|nr:hypothetical protein BO95DRAFT_517069 [Aspergillus brunneoviolaceus CBS 621.78]RAH42507.1 hypothetical protein BO95DRAFT_517069 [Aspergillus brunneoviolaceus CBS 621.78]
MSSVKFDGSNFGLQVANNNGGITAQLHVPPERPETPPHPLSTVPFRRDPDFVDRGTLLDQIREKCSAPASRIALVGLGGVGKSQLAIEYCYRVRENFPSTWVFWVHTSNAARFEQGFQEIADRVRIPGRKDPKANIFQLVGGWLNDEKRAKWTLVLDNVDDDEFLNKAAPSDSGSTTGKVLLEYIPQSPHGSIIITSRSAAVAARIVEPRDIITIAPMHKTDARLLFQKKLDVREDCTGDEVDELMAALEYMPLAIVQAASYIRYRLPRFSVSHYLQLFQKSDRKKLSLLDHEGGHLRRDQEAHNSIMITWQITFDHLRRARPSAADLLSLMSFFDRQGIPEALLRHQEDEDNHKLDLREKGLANLSDEDSTSSHDDQFDVDVLTLRDYSFISITGVDVFEMHRLVQLATLKWLEIQGQFQKWRERFIDILSNASPTSDYENWGTLQIFLPHIRMAATQPPGVVHAQAAEWEEAEFCMSRVKDIQERKLGREHRETLSTTADLANIYLSQDRCEEAERLQLQVLNTCKTALGPRHRITLTSMDYLSRIYQNKKQWREAEEIQVQITEANIAISGPEHPATLQSMGQLSPIYQQQGRLKEAAQLGRHIVESSKRELGAEDFETLMGMQHLATACGQQGQWEEAKELHTQVLYSQLKLLSPEHPLIDQHEQPCILDASDALVEWQTETCPSRPGEEEVSTETGMLSQQEA